MRHQPYCPASIDAFGIVAEPNHAPPKSIPFARYSDTSRDAAIGVPL